MIAKALRNNDLVLFLDGLDECRQPERTASILGTLTSNRGMVELSEELKGGVFVHYQEGSPLYDHDHNIKDLYGVQELYVSTRPERIGAIPEPSEDRVTRFSKLEYTGNELLDSLPRGLLDAWGIDSGEIMALSLLARWQCPFAFLNPWCIGHVLNMIREGTLELPKIDDWSDFEFFSQIIRWADLEWGSGAGRSHFFFYLICLVESRLDLSDNERSALYRLVGKGSRRPLPDFDLYSNRISRPSGKPETEAQEFLQYGDSMDDPPGYRAHFNNAVIWLLGDTDSFDRNKLLLLLTSGKPKVSLDDPKSLTSHPDNSGQFLASLDFGPVNSGLGNEEWIARSLAKVNDYLSFWHGFNSKGLTGRELRPSAKREAKFFSRILDSTVRNSLRRKGHLRGIPERSGDALVREVTDFVGFISISSENNLIDFNDFHEFIKCSKEFLDTHGGIKLFPKLVGMRQDSFLELFEEDLTSLYSLVESKDYRRRKPASVGHPLGKRRWFPVWEHNRMKDAAALRLFFNEQCSDSRDYLRQLTHSPDFHKLLTGDKRMSKRYITRRFNFDWGRTSRPI